MGDEVSALRFEELTAVVTEVGGALGRATALAVAARGARVVVADDRTDVASRLAQEIVAGGGSAVAHRVGFGPESGRALVERALQEWGAIDVLVHDTTSFVADPSPAAPLAPLVGAQDQLAGLSASWWLIQAAWIAMRQRHYGRIVVGVPMDRSLDPSWHRGDAVTSFGLLGLMNVLKVEGAEHDLKVNMVVPGAPAETGMTTDLMTYLAHRDCKPTGEVFTVSPAGVARSFIGVNGGAFDPTLRVEAVRRRIGEILSPADFIVPDQAGEEIDLLMNELR
ncbi:MAG TPA: SDR family NAD(P)-dependent oxidoreductase [Acidimicrobiales bacterium]